MNYNSVLDHQSSMFVPVCWLITHTSAAEYDILNHLPPILPNWKKNRFIYFFTQYCSVYLPWCEVWSISHWVYEYMASLAWYSVLSFSSYANSSKDGNISLLVCLSGGPPLSSRNISTTVGWIAVKCCIVSHYAQKMNPYVFADPLNFHLVPLSGQFLNVCTALDSD